MVFRFSLVLQETVFAFTRLHRHGWMEDIFYSPSKWAPKGKSIYNLILCTVWDLSVTLVYFLILQPNLLATDPNYPHIVYVEHGNVDNGSCKSTSAVVKDENTDLEGLFLFTWLCIVSLLYIRKHHKLYPLFFCVEHRGNATWAWSTILGKSRCKLSQQQATIRSS